jgi:hypothetical protein
MKTVIEKTLLAAAGLALALPAWAQIPRARGEIAVSLGVGFTRAEGLTVQRQSWTGGPLDGTSISNTLSVTGRPALVLGASYTNFFSGALGIQAGFSYLKSGLEAGSEFSRGLAGVPARRLAADPDPSEVTAVPLYAALALGWRGPRTGFVLTAGPALILHSLLAETRAGTVLANASGPAAYSVNASLPDQTWVAFGGVLGAALDLAIDPGLALCFEARYVLSPARSAAWSFAEGTAEGLEDPAARAAFDAAAASLATAGAPRVSINPSFWQLSIGIKFKLDAR